MKAYEYERSVEPWTAEQPHFNDERTLLSAQPVVPLENIKARVRNRRYWLLAGAFAIAMMLGAGSALLASYLRLRNVPAQAVSQEEITPPAPEAVAESVPSESPLASESPAVSESPAPESVEGPDEVAVEEPKTESTRRRRTVAPAADDDVPRNEPRVAEEDDLNRVREAVLYDQWKERRARRVARQERRRSDRSNRDLSNLDEIFEGRRSRPPN
jgi:hypothetical protein